MKINSKNVCEFKLDEEEKESLQKTYDIFDEIVTAMKENNCGYIVGGYFYDPTVYSRDELIHTLRTIEDIKDAWQIRKDEFLGEES